MLKQRLALLALPFLAAAAPHDADKLRDAALKDRIAWDIVEGLTTNVLFSRSFSISATTCGS